MAVITALRERPRGQVEVDLVGRSWRLVPADAVVRTGLVVGRALDRETARALRRELRRSEALAFRKYEQALQKKPDLAEALAAEGMVFLNRGDKPRAKEKLEAALKTDLAGRSSLEEDGLLPEVVKEALASLDPEPERARRLLDERGATAKTVRWLAAKGFDHSTVEDLGEFADGG